MLSLGGERLTPKVFILLFIHISSNLILPSVLHLIPKPPKHVDNIYHLTSLVSHLSSNVARTSFMLIKLLRTIAILLLTPLSHLPFCYNLTKVSKVPYLLKYLTIYIYYYIPLFTHFVHPRRFCVTFMYSPKFSLCSFTLFTTSCSFSLLSATSAVLSAYKKLFMFSPPTERPGSSSRKRNIGSVYKLNSFGDSTQPCLTPLSMSNPFLSYKTNINVIE